MYLVRPVGAQGISSRRVCRAKLKRRSSLEQVETSHRRTLVAAEAEANHWRMVMALDLARRPRLDAKSDNSFTQFDALPTSSTPSSQPGAKIGANVLLTGAAERSMRETGGSHDEPMATEWASVTIDRFHRQLAQNRSALLSTARRRLRNPVWAEDAVSETLLAALERRPDFTAPTRVRAWLFGILRHKVVDQLRQHVRDEEVLSLSDRAESEVNEIGDPCRHADPMNCVMDRQFIDALNGQLERLPQMHADAFFMRECWGDGTAELCAQFAVSAGNLGVMLHRTRHRLRQALLEHGA